MCEFCHKHGEGKKWYLQAKNYSEELLNDLSRVKFIEEFFSHPEKLEKGDRDAAKLLTAPEKARKVIGKMITRGAMRDHFGQVVPIEDIEEILKLSTSIVRLECICRKTTVGPEQRFCYGLSLAPGGGKLAEIINKIDPHYLNGPENRGLEILSKEEALKAFRDYENKGLCHTIWTFRAPFIGGICNCNAKDCYAMRMTVGVKVPVMFKSEFIAGVDESACTGCKKCVRLCQFNAINFDSSKKKITINRDECYGCGICRSVCEKNAICLAAKATGA